MKKKIALSLSALMATGLVAAEDFSSMIKDGKFDGYVRLHHINTSTSDTVAITGSFIGGKLKYETAPLYGLSIGTAMYTSHDTGLTKWDYLTKDKYNQVAGGLAGNKDIGSTGRFNNYSTIGEAYLNYKYSKTSAKLGRQTFASPMTTSEVTIIPNLYEAGVLTVKEIDNLTIQAAHLSRMMFGTRATTESQLIGDGGVYGIVTGAGLAHAKATEGKEVFHNMGKAAFGDKGSDKGVTTLSVEYDKGPLKLRVWDYYAQDMFNTAYADIDYKMDLSGAKLFLSAQALHQTDVGDFKTSDASDALKAEKTVTDISGKKKDIYKTQISKNGDIDAFFWGIQAKVKISDFMINTAFTQNTKGHIINPWGGNFGYTSTIFSRNENRADTDAYKLGFNYDFATLGVKGLKFIYNFAEYKSDVDTTEGSRTEKSNEHDFILRYDSPDVKGLWLTLFHVERDNDTREYKQSHTRFVANLSF